MFDLFHFVSRTVSLKNPNFEANVKPENRTSNLHFLFDKSQSHSDHFLPLSCFSNEEKKKEKKKERKKERKENWKKNKALF